MANTATAHLEPRDRGAIDGTMPFRRFYIGFRFLVLPYEIATLGFLISLDVRYPERDYALGFAAIAMALALDLVAIGVLVRNKDLRGGSSFCFNCCDIVVLIMSIIGCLAIFLADFNMEGYPSPPEEWDYDEPIGGFMVMGVAIAHVWLSIASCIGACVSCGRARRAKRRPRVVYLVPVVGPVPDTEAAK